MSFPKPFFRWRPHPWHGLSIGDEAPRLVNAYIEITPSDPVKYEIDKETGYLRVDRPQKTNSLPPALYGFVPRTWCGPRVAALAGAETGDRDPLDICVLSERPITRAEVLLTARVVGVIRMIDRGEADDKLVAVLHNDPFFEGVEEVSDLHPLLVGRLQHYFETYKLTPGEAPVVKADRIEGAASAHAVLQAASADYEEEYGG